MEAISSFFAMGGHAGFVWPAYGVAVVVLGGLVWSSVRALRAREADLKAIEAVRPRRRRGSGSDDP